MESIGRILPKSLKKAGISRQVQTVLIIEQFAASAAEVLGASAAKKVKALYLKDKILTVACLSSVLAQELQLHQRKILNNLNKNFGQVVAEKIRFLS